MAKRTPDQKFDAMINATGAFWTAVEKYFPDLAPQPGAISQEIYKKFADISAEVIDLYVSGANEVEGDDDLLKQIQAKVSGNSLFAQGISSLMDSNQTSKEIVDQITSQCMGALSTAEKVLGPELIAVLKSRGIKSNQHRGNKDNDRLK